MNNRLCLIISALLLCAIAGFGNAQDEETPFDLFQRNLLDSFIGPLQADGVAVTAEQRAMFMGYLLNRQSQYNGRFESDEIRLQALTNNVKEFLETVSPNQDLWSTVEAGMRGEYEQQVHQLLGGSPFVRPMFQSLDDIAEKWRDLKFDMGAYYQRNDCDDIMKIALDYLRALKDGRYEEALELTAGRNHEQLSRVLKDFESSPEQKARLDNYFKTLEWKVGDGELSNTEPPVVRILFGLPGPDGKWADEYCFLILDNGKWKIFRFID